jgi:DNA-directed RNA polymerase specialized sigma24 family protein
MNNKNKALEMLAEYHSEYIKMARAIANNNNEVYNYAEDFVQEAYLRLARYDDLFDKVVNTKGKVSKGYMFFVLRSIIVNAIKKKSNLKFNYLGSQYDFEETYNFIDEGVDRDKLGLEAIEQKMYSIVKDGSKWFDYSLFKTYLETGKSFRTIAEESGIGIRTIYLSIKRSKLLIAEKLHEDYQDFLNDQHELI